MVLGDVHSCLAQQSSNASDHAGHIVVGKNQESVARLHIDVESADPGEPWRYTWLCRSCDCYLLHPAAQSYFDGKRIVLRRSLGRREIDAAILGYRSSVDEIEAFLFDRSFEQAACS